MFLFFFEMHNYMRKKYKSSNPFICLQSASVKFMAGLLPNCCLILNHTRYQFLDNTFMHFSHIHQHAHEHNVWDGTGCQGVCVFSICDAASECNPFWERERGVTHSPQAVSRVSYYLGLASPGLSVLKGNFQHRMSQIGTRLDHTLQ